MAPPPKAWTTLADTTHSKFGASATNADPMEKTINAAWKHPDAAVDVGQTPCQWHRYGVADQVPGYDPGRPVQVGKRDLQVHHHRGQGGDHHGLVQGSREYPQADDPQHHSLGRSQGLEAGPGSAHDPEAVSGSSMSTGELMSLMTTSRVVSGASSS